MYSGLPEMKDDSKLLETLNSVLMLPDCPGRMEVMNSSRAVCTVSTPPREGTTGARTSRTPPLRARRAARVNVIDTASPDSAGTSGSGSGGTSDGSGDRTDSEECYGYDQGPPGEDVPGPFTNYEEACLKVLQIEVPDRDKTPNNMFTYDSYHRAVLAIQENPSAAYAQHCIACRGQHRFKNCPTLNNHDFLKQHYILLANQVPPFSPSPTLNLIHKRDLRRTDTVTSISS